MRPLWRRTLYALTVLLLLLAGLAWWLVQGFDGEHVKRIASDWMRTQHQRELVFDGPVRLQLWRVAEKQAYFRLMNLKTEKPVLNRGVFEWK